MFCLIVFNCLFLHFPIQLKNKSKDKDFFQFLLNFNKFFNLLHFSTLFTFIENCFANNFFNCWHSKKVLFFECWLLLKNWSMAVVLWSCCFLARLILVRLLWFVSFANQISTRLFFTCSFLFCEIFDGNLLAGICTRARSAMFASGESKQSLCKCYE